MKLIPRHLALLAFSTFAMGTGERLDLKDLTLAGESMGATLSLSAAAELGSRVNRIVALNTYDYSQGVERANLLATMVGC